MGGGGGDADMDSSRFSQ
jgi:hypothetical protein